MQANAQTGRLTAIFDEAPQVPFEDLTLTFNGGPRAPLANPLGCGLANRRQSSPPTLRSRRRPRRHRGSTLTPTAAGAPVSRRCPSRCVQSTPPQSPPDAGAYSPFALDLARGEGQQYLSQVQTTLPPGLLGAIPSVTLCLEPQANAGTCPSASEIGTVAVSAGAGPEP